MEMILHEAMMREAIKQAVKASAHDEVPVGAIIVHDRQVIARAHDQVELLHDPTAHAEMIAITQASNFLASKWLHDCVMYVTIEPCSMCAGAIVLARLKKVFYGAAAPKTGACGSVLNIPGNKTLNHQVEIEGGLLAEECGAVLSEFFRIKRQRSKA